MTVEEVYKIQLYIYIFLMFLMISAIVLIMNVSYIILKKVTIINLRKVKKTRGC